MDVQDEITKRFETEVLDVCDRIFSEGVRQMRYAMENAGLVLTEELKRSLYSERTYVSGQLEAQFRMGMRGYGRFKDMKKITYANFPDVDALVEFIEGVGVEKFINNDTATSVTLFVPGYFINTRRRVALSTDRAPPGWPMPSAAPCSTVTPSGARRTRFTMSTRVPSTTRSAGTSWRNYPRMMEALKEYYERPFYEKDEWWG